ncbi:MAG TPA: DNA-binding domain-containing protein [Candidatus Binatia bacterium]|nr:DNA-binding domain-containing protein [Candidatus Binatia bacterium]
MTASLSDLQAGLAQCLVTGEPFAAADVIVPGGTLSAETALDVYRRGYPVRLTDQLGETYESVWWVLGDQGFFDLCRRFIARTPSLSYNLGDYGERFAEFVATQPESEQMEALPDLARLDWRFRLLFHQAEHDHVSPDALASVDDLSAVTLELGSAVELFESRFAVGEIFARRKDPPDAGPALEWRRSQRLLLYKLDGQIWIKELDLAAFAVLRALRDGRGVEDALAAGSDADAGFGPEQASSVFEMLARFGLVGAVHRRRSPVRETD